MSNRFHVEPSHPHGTWGRRVGREFHSSGKYPINFTLPLVVAAAIEHYAGASMTVQVPGELIIGQVFLLLGVPVALGR